MTDITKFNRNGSIRDIGDSKARNSIAKEFSTTTSYSINNLILHDGQLYKFTSDHEAGIWNSSEVISTNILDWLLNNDWKDSGLIFAKTRKQNEGESNADYADVGRFKLYYRIIGNLCAVSGEVRLKDDLPTGTGISFNELWPEEARPKIKRAFFPANCLAGYGFFIIGTDGIVQLQNRSGNTYLGGPEGHRLFVAGLYVLD